MKKLFFFGLLICLCGFAFSQTTLSLRPNRDVGLGYHDNYDTENTNYGDAPQISGFAISGTQGGLLANRALFDFDFSSIPQGSQIISAKLSLYAFNAHSNPLLQPGHFGGNACYLRLITEQWDEYQATWNNQPSATNLNEVILPQSITADQDYLDIDVAALVQAMIDDPNGTHGFKLGLVNEIIPTNLSFHSTDSGDTLKSPLLEVTYSECREYTLVAYRDASLAYHDGEDSENVNYGDAPHVSGFAIDATIPSGLLANRAIIDFDLSSIPQDATVDSAFISLYAFNGHANPILQAGQFGNNACYLSRTTEQWDENTATWNNQANATTQNQVTLPQSTSSNQDYLNIDVTTLVQDMVANPNSSFGFKLQLVDETKSKSLSFHSKDGSNPDKHPKLRVIVNCKNTSVPKTNELQSNYFSVYPNPSDGEFNISFNDIRARQVEIYAMDGKLIRSLQTSEMKSLIDLSDLSKGVYFIKCFSEDNSFSKKLILN